MLEQDLLRNECYICQDSCGEKSPCECEAYVHLHCLEKFTDISENKICTICKTRIVEDTDLDTESEDSVSESSDSMPPQLFILIIFIIYLIMGVLGKMVLGKSGQAEDIFSFWTGTFFMCSCATSAGVILPIYLVITSIKHYQRR